MTQSPDLTLENALSDPMIRAAMRADRVDPVRFEALLRETAQRLESARRVPVVAFALAAQRSRRSICEMMLCG